MDGPCLWLLLGRVGSGCCGRVCRRRRGRRGVGAVRRQLRVVAPHTTVDLACADGSAIPIEQRHGDEVRGVSGAFGNALWAPAQAPVFNPAFDVTPAALVTGWVLDTGVYSQADIAAGVLIQFA